ncbi:glycoside hydrolase family 68 protein [Erythrobacter sp. EC-HK427]|uniref:glycoside hydrolase family 68 protein n=1 Tax=Erythrobacter sp. EC-HK427 TaxID=2038396 RepID=UPI00125A0657|nr:glycoside hydrolase family 68 protein [Erythrobacter sp. EC-HK427]VVT20978.1 Levansucrase [Erythrobacter sp. EC-HK427]
MSAPVQSIREADAAASKWPAEALLALRLSEANQAPELDAADVQFVSPELDIWDAWPLADAAGQPVPWRGGELWFALAAPRGGDPEARHHLARIHSFHRTWSGFAHLSAVLPPALSPGAREWSGSALFEAGTVTLFFTAAGRRGDDTLTFHQTIYATRAAMQPDGDFGEWSVPQEIVAADGLHYRPANENHGEPGKIKAFRDPAHYRDANGKDYVVFTGSSASHPGLHDGVIGIASDNPDGTFTPMPPLIDAVGTSNELERPHIVAHCGLLYLFWSTQSSVFAPGIAAPTGLYGARAASLAGPWTLLNGSGLVIGNPPERPRQAYSWWVLPDLSVTSFVDYWGINKVDGADVSARRAQFGGTFAPFLQLALDGDRSRLVG